MKRNKHAIKTSSKGSYSRKMANGHVPIRHSNYPKFGE